MIAVVIVWRCRSIRTCVVSLPPLTYCLEGSMAKKAKKAKKAKEAKKAKKKK